MPKDQQEHVTELLTEEELAALDDSDYVDDEEDDGTPPVTATDDDLGDDGDDDAGDDEGRDDADPIPSAAADDEPEPQAATPVAVDTGRLTQLQEEYDATQTAIEDLTAQFEDGDFTSAEFKSKLAELNGKLIDVQSDAKIIQRQVEAENASWDKAVGGYFAENPELKASDDVLQAFDVAVRYVTKSFPNMSFEQQLAKAHDQLVSEAADRGLKGVPPRKGGKAATPQRRTGSQPDDGMRTPPTTLARAPASEISGEADSALLQMQKLIEDGDSDKIEAAYRKLSPEQRDAFSNMDI